VGIPPTAAGGKAALAPQVPPFALPGPGDQVHTVAIVSHDHAQAGVYSPNDKGFRGGRLGSLSAFPTDQILLARVLAGREGCYLHSGGVILDGGGLLFVGHSEAGKTTLLRMLEHDARFSVTIESSSEDGRRTALGFTVPGAMETCRRFRPALRP